VLAVGVMAASFFCPTRAALAARRDKLAGAAANA
jgi:hypothetical protein